VVKLHIVVFCTMTLHILWYILWHCQELKLHT